MTRIEEAIEFANKNFIPSTTEGYYALQEIITAAEKWNDKMNCEGCQWQEYETTNVVLDCSHCRRERGFKRKRDCYKRKVGL